jgi:hypothetical protein
MRRKISSFSAGISGIKNRMGGISRLVGIAVLYRAVRMSKRVFKPLRGGECLVGTNIR